MIPEAAVSERDKLARLVWEAIPCDRDTAERAAAHILAGMVPVAEWQRDKA